MFRSKNSNLRRTDQTSNGKVTESEKVLTSDALDSCKCSYCNCYLSVAPIRMVDDQVACGRCKLSSKGIRLRMMEAMAENFIFPCRYKATGCKAKLEWPLVGPHEMSCHFKEIYCIITDCYWFGPASSMKAHFEQDHLPQVINSRKCVTINLQDSKVYHFLYVYKERIFLVLLANDRKEIVHQVKCLGTSQEASGYAYDIHISDPQRHLIYLNQKLQSFDNDIGIFNQGLSVDALQSVFGDKNINIKFAIRCSDRASKLLTSSIDCPVCLEPMLDKIIIGMCGHSVCEECKKTLLDCPCCRSKYDNLASGIVFGSSPSKYNIRNYALESLIKKFNSVTL